MNLSNGHINLFSDLEEHAAALAARASKSKPPMTDSDHGVPLAPMKEDLHPWYSATRPSGKDDETAEARRRVPILLRLAACCPNSHTLRRQTARLGTPTQGRSDLLYSFAPQEALACDASTSNTVTLPTATITATSPIFGLARRPPRPRVGRTDTRAGTLAAQTTGT